MIFCAKGFVLLAVVNIPEFLFCIVRSCIQTFETGELLNLLLELPVRHNRINRVSWSRAPDSDIEQQLFAQPVFLIDRSVPGM